MKLGCGETRDGNWGGPEGWFLRLRVMSEGIGAMGEDEVSGRRGVTGCKEDEEEIFKVLI